MSMSVTFGSVEYLEVAAVDADTLSSDSIIWRAEQVGHLRIAHDAPDLTSDELRCMLIY